MHVESRSEAERRAVDYLAGARTAGEIAGRQLALLAMAVYADEDAVAMSSRSGHYLQHKGPWAAESGELLDALARDQLPERILTALEPTLKQRQEQRGRLAAELRERDQARARLEGIEQRIADLDAEQLDQVAADVETAWVGWEPRKTELRRAHRPNARCPQPEGLSVKAGPSTNGLRDGPACSLYTSRTGRRHVSPPERPPSALGRQLPGVDLDGEPRTGVVLSGPGIEARVVLELHYLVAAANDDPGPRRVVLRHRESNLTHERMFP